MELERILTQSEQIFFKYGLKSVTMDDVARHLSISKKTLYKHFENKADLVKKVMHFHLEDDDAHIEACQKEAKNAIDAMLQIGRYMSHKLANLNPSVMYDMKKYYPRSWSLFEEHLHGSLYGCIGENLTRGIKEGLYQKKLNKEVVSRIYAVQARNIAEVLDFMNVQIDFKTFFKAYLSYHIHGIASEKGIEYLKSVKFD